MDGDLVYLAFKAGLAYTVYKVTDSVVLGLAAPMAFVMVVGGAL